MMERLIKGNCLEIMDKFIRDGVTVDMILTDPPYLINYKTGYRKGEHRFKSPILGDTDPELIISFLEKSSQILKDGGAIYMFCNSDKVDFFKTNFEKYFKFKNILIWVKNNWTAGDLKGAYAKQTEFIIYGVKGRHLLNGGRDRDVIFCDKVAGNEQVHQNQKPITLLQHFISKSSVKGDTVFDPFMGSGSTGVACKLTGRNFIGIELDDNFFETARQRIGGRDEV